MFSAFLSEASLAHKIAFSMESLFVFMFCVLILSLLWILN